MRKIIALMICTLFLAGSSNAEMVITNSVDVEAEVGDFIQYEFVDDSFILGIANAIDEEKYLRYEDKQGGNLRMEITTKGETLHEGETVDFIAVEMSWHQSFTLIFDDLMDDDDGKEDMVEVDYSLVSEIWDLDASYFSTANNTAIKDGMTMIINFNMTINQYEDQTIYWSSSIEKTTTDFIDQEGIEPSTYEVGSLWSITTTNRISGTERTRDCWDGDCEDWVTEEIDEETTVTQNSEVVGEKSLTTPAGTFQVLEIKETEDGEDPGNYTLNYLDDTGLPVALKMYTEDTMTMNVQLESYKISGLGSLDADGSDIVEEGLPSIPFILSLMTVAFVAVRVAGRQS